MITTVINYCTHDFRFLERCVNGALAFSYRVIVPVCDHFFDGTPEDKSLLCHSFCNNPRATFIEYSYGSLYGLYPEASRGREVNYWHSTSRYIGWKFADEASHLLFIDVDEIVDPERFLLWKDQYPWQDMDGLRFSTYYYFRDPRFRAKKWARNPLLARKDRLSAAILLDPDERLGTYVSVVGKKALDVNGMDEKPLFHHYSFVRTKEEALKKVSRWGHRDNRDWNSLIEKEFHGEFSGQESLNDMTYDRVDLGFNPMLVDIPSRECPKKPKNLIKVNQKDLFLKELSL